MGKAVIFSSKSLSLIFKFKHAKLRDSGSSAKTLCFLVAANNENKPTLAPISTKTELASKPSIHSATSLSVLNK